MSDATMNLTAPRSLKSVWDEPGFAASLSSYDQERWVAVASGSVLTMLGARRGGLAGGVVTLLGATLTIRAAMGRHDLRAATNWLNRTMRDRGYVSGKDIVGDASEESFPASDSPSWTATAGASTRR